MSKSGQTGSDCSDTCPRIIVFLKAPRPGLVKTRLAAAAGQKKAVEIYRILVESQMRRLPEGWPVEIRFAPTDAEAEMKKWIGEQATYLPQDEGDLGDRLAGAVADAFSRGSDPVICIGADCPDLDVRDLEAARKFLLEGVDLVFGPAEDGGYYLIGLGGPCPEVFNGIPWSSENTLSRSLEQAHKCDRRVSFLPQKRDIDYLEDWKKYCGTDPVTSKE